jgi:hypothetical protein
VSSLYSCGPLAYSDNEHVKQLLYSLDDSVWGMQIIALEESADFTTLDTEKLFIKLKSQVLSRKGHPNHDAYHTSNSFITSACVGGNDANHTNTTVSSVLKFVLSSLSTASDEQYKSIPDDKIVLLVRKFRALHRFRKERRRSPRGCFECSNTTHFIVDCPKRTKLDSSNEFDYIKQNDYSKDDDMKKHRFGNNNKKKFQKIMSRACAALSDFNISNDDSSSSDEDEKVKRKPGNFTSLCLMGKSSRQISNCDVSHDLSPESLSLRVTELKNALYSQDKLLCKIFRKNNSLRSVHDDMSVKPCDNCKMIIVNYADMWLVHSHVASLLDGARLELRELKTRSTLLGSYTTCPWLRSDLEASATEIKDLKHKLHHSSRYTVLFPPCDACGSLEGKLFHAAKQNTKLKQEVTYLTACLEKTILNEKMIEDDLSRVEESATKSTYILNVGF